MAERVAVAAQDRYVQLRIVELVGLLLLVYRPVFPHRHLLLAADRSRVASSLFRSLPGLAPRGGAEREGNQGYIFPPVAAHPQLVELVDPSPALLHLVVSLEGFSPGGLVRRPKVNFEIDHIFLVGLFISGRLAEGEGRG